MNADTSTCNMQNLSGTVDILQVPTYSIYFENERVDTMF